MPATAVLAPLDYSTDVIPCDNRSCREAQSHHETCDCICGGAGHGAPFRAGRAAAAADVRARIVRTNDVFLGAAADDDEEW